MQNFMLNAHKVFTFQTVVFKSKQEFRVSVNVNVTKILNKFTEKFLNFHKNLKFFTFFKFFVYFGYNLGRNF